MSGRALLAHKRKLIDVSMMGLAEYGRKRHFTKTSEPPPATAGQDGFSYVIQKHDASHLHYDFRLELDGVLKSWAIPKGPSLDPSIKRLAVQVEDHPVAYGSFEGIIPQGEYGGGTVLLWDHGNWEPVGNPHTGLRDGKLKFLLHGTKLHGGWSLVRTRRPGSPQSKPQWLLIKERDEGAVSSDEGDVLEKKPLSVVSERDLDEIANSPDKVSSSNPGLKKNTSKKTTPEEKSLKKADAPTVLMPSSIPKNATIERPPEKIDVQLATLADRAPEGDEWVHEIKFDGYRMICRIDGDHITFITRNHNDWTAKLANLVTVAGSLSCKQAILDGELVVIQPDGTTDFQALQNAFRDQRTTGLKYYIFDLLHLDGHNLAKLPLEERKATLEELLDNPKTRNVFIYSEHVTGHGVEFKQQACKLHLEGIICKRREQPYRSGRSSGWLKVKCIHDDEFVIGGFTEPSGSRMGFGALLVGFYDDSDALHYAGKVGTGFDERQLKELHVRLKALEQNDSPFVDLTRKAGAGNKAHWVKPILVGQFKYGSQTRDNKLRHASFQGLREDKAADEVRMETTVPAEKTQKKEATRPGKRSTAETKKQADSNSAKKKSSAMSAEKGGADYDASTETFAGVRLSHPQKILYAESGISKLEVAAYYNDIADWILPQLANRPIVLLRCPDGSTKQCFYQKHPGLGTPKCLRQIPIAESRKTLNYLIVDDIKGLLSLPQLGALEIHVWGSREDHLEKPDRLVFDLDPDTEVPWSRVIEGARQIREFLRQLGLECFLKTTGGKGLHLVVPIERKHDWSQAKEFCKQVADLVTLADPSHFTATLSKASRTNKIFIDYLRNARGATAVVAYSTRARANATVSMPIDWKELNPKLTSDHFTIRNAMTRLRALNRDPWEKLTSTRQSLADPIKQLKSLAATLPAR